MKNTLVVLLFSVITSIAFSQQNTESGSYYGADFENSIVRRAHDGELKQALLKILKSGHVHSATGPDQIVTTCEGQSQCTTQTSIGYEGARHFLFGSFYLVKNAGGYGIQEMYCDRIYQGADFKKGALPGPGIIPDNTIINVEHTWPQSRFTGKYPADLQKADLHHLFPTDSKMNALRGSNSFGEVIHDSQKETCNASKAGSGTDGGRPVFEPPQHHKGHVARALFYFSVRYEIAISPNEEAILQKWNKDYPVDDIEKARNEAIFKVQGNRNPFIDYPELAANISDF